MSDPTFTTHGNEPVEARIVSWVLGEASAFEAAELERLCDAQPELMIFKRRMEAVHGLLGEAERPPRDALWKLTSRKRLAIEKLISEADQNEIHRAREQARDQRVNRSGRRAGWAIAACVLFAIVALALLDPFDLVKVHTFQKVMSKSVDFLPAASEEHRSNYSLADAESVPMQQQTKSKRMLLSTPIPPELIEGTPKPIDVPNLESPVNGPAGGMSSGLGGSGTRSELRASAPMPAASKARSNSSFAVGDTPLPNIPLSGAMPSLSSGVTNSFSETDTIAIQGKAKAIGGVIKREEVVNSSSAIAADSNSDAFAAASSEVAPSEELARTDEGSRRSRLPVMKGRIADRKETEAREFKVDETSSLFGRDQDSASAGEKSKKTDGLKGQAEGAVIKRGLDAQDYVDAKHEDESEKGFLMKLEDQRDAVRDSQDGALDADALKQKVREQEKRVGQSRKVLAKAARPQGMASGAGKPVPKTRSEAEDYKKLIEDFQKDKTLLGEMKQQLKELEASPEPKPVVPVDAGEETSAAQEPYSTFSLNISDASFRIAQAALAKGEQPDPAGIQVEQFYNAVNYGDPAPATAQPVAGTVEQVAHPVVPGRTLVRVAIKTAAAGRSAQQSLRLTLLADQSGSMVREDRREAMNQALKGLGDLLTPNDVVNVIGFSRTPHLLAEGLQGQQAKQLQGLINMDANEGGTNLEEAMKLGEQLAKRYQQQGAQNRVVLFTDGAANLGDADPQSLAKKVEQLRQSGISFDIAGIAADGINDELLAELARKGNGRYYIVGKGESDQLAKQLAGAFNPAAENVKVQVRFNPARVGGYKLIGFEKDRLKKEDFRNDKVDAAEMAAEEAGVAIYQVEPLPEGEGELGEVSVRFRDTATGEMVERTWTIPYDSSAPSMEQATASMQLAVMSMLAGEKLKGGPLADAIDFKQLGKAQANVRQTFGADQRVGEMLQMIDQLK